MGLTKEEVLAFDGLEQSYRDMDSRIIAPVCHFTAMSYEEDDYESWWICHHCGHTKSIGFMEIPH